MCKVRIISGILTAGIRSNNIISSFSFLIFRPNIFTVSQSEIELLKIDDSSHVNIKKKHLHANINVN